MTAVANAREGRGRAHLDAPRLLLCAVVVAVGVLSMPARLYRGDPFVIRMAAAHFLKTGELGIPFARSGRLAAALSERGQYFVENLHKERYYSKYGALSSGLVLPPMLVLRALGHPPSTDSFDDSDSLLLALNVYNILLSVLIALYLYALARRFTPSSVTAFVFVLSSFYATFLWNYLRAQSNEIFQVLFFCAMSYHLFASRNRSGVARLLQLGASMLFAALLTLSKPYYALVFPGALLMLSMPDEHRSHARLITPASMFVVVCALVVGGCVIAQNAIAFGDPLDFGYQQWQQAGVPVNRMSAANLPHALYGFLLGADRSVFTHFPVLALSMFGIPIFWRSHRAELVFIVSTVVSITLLLGSFSNWRGDWCYGPRYLIFGLPVVSLFSLPMLDRLIVRPRAAFAVGVGAGYLVILALSLFFQLQVNRLEFHANYCARDWFQGVRDPAIDAYFHSHEGLVFGDLSGWKHGRAELPPLRDAKALINPIGIAKLEHALRTSCLQGNYLLFPD